MRDVTHAFLRLALTPAASKGSISPGSTPADIVQLISLCQRERVE